MFKLFKREEPAAKPSRRTPAKVAAPPAATPPGQPGPDARAPLAPSVVEVREDHDESAWDLWEESNFQLDSQMGGLSPFDSVRVRDARPSQAADLGADGDPFSRVGKNDR